MTKKASQLEREIHEVLSKPRGKPSTLPARLDPYRNSQQDVRDALAYMRESYDVPADACFIEKRETLSLRKILSYDDYGAWGELDPGELAGMRRDALLAALTAFRGRAWAETAVGWVTDTPGTQKHANIPAVVLFDSQYGAAVADGRGRVNLAVGLNLPRLHVIRIVDCKR